MALSINYPNAGTGRINLRNRKFIAYGSTTDAGDSPLIGTLRSTNPDRYLVGRTRREPRSNGDRGWSIEFDLRRIEAVTSGQFTLTVYRVNPPTPAAPLPTLTQRDSI